MKYCFSCWRGEAFCLSYFLRMPATVKTFGALTRISKKKSQFFRVYSMYLSVGAVWKKSLSLKSLKKVWKTAFERPKFESATYGYIYLWVLYGCYRNDRNLISFELNSRCAGENLIRHAISFSDCKDRKLFGRKSHRYLWLQQWRGRGPNFQCGQSFATCFLNSFFFLKTVTGLNEPVVESFF